MGSVPLTPDWVNRFAALVGAQRHDLDRLDAVAGDGDHGTTVSRGLAAAVSAVDRLGPVAPAERLVAAGRAFVGAAGGAIGPLLGSCLIVAGEAMGAGADLADALDAGSSRVTELGGAAPGDCTLLDALVPAISALRRGEDAVAAARTGAAATAALSARKGRAASSPEGGRGTADPGAHTVALMVEAMCGSS
ncbi:MAG: DAK2 domain-containing protein [Acidimicrobiia bacterium]